MFLFKLQAERVIPGICDIGQPVRHSQREEHSGVSAERDSGSALLHLVQSGPADGGALRQDCHRNTPPPPGITEIPPELAEGACHWYWHTHNVHILGLYLI
jgi:hypothetical protein